MAEIHLFGENPSAKIRTVEFNGRPVQTVELRIGNDVFLVYAADLHAWITQMVEQLLRLGEIA